VYNLIVVKSQVHFLYEVQKFSVYKFLMLLTYCALWLKFSFFIVEILSHVTDIILNSALHEVI
jgi:hypothetical protein